jgi:cytochrome b involved in lipid metabolism
MKILVGIVMVLHLVFMGSVAIYGNMQYQKEAAKQKETLAPQPTPQTQPETPSATPAEPEPEPAPTGITAAEVAKHNKPSDCWIIISGNVYDVGSYLALHPGGTDVIVPFCGRDATQAFNTQGGRGRHSSRATTELQKHLVGPLQ